MALLFWDASALAKRYFGEVGSATVNALFGHTASQDMATTPWGYAETYSILLRRRNSGVIDPPTFTTSVSALQAEVVNGPDFLLMSVSDPVVFASVSLMGQHNLNSTDAILLTLLLEFARLPDAPTCVLVAADKRLVRAAQSEGLKTLNPELVPAADAAAFLAPHYRPA